MGKKYYIGILGKLIDKLENSTNMVIKYDNKNIIEVDSDEDLNKLIEIIKESDFLDDKAIKEVLERELPPISKYITKIPIELNELKKAFNEIFDLPQEIF
ncbi:hypothetical protein J4405_06080, partial [Candidatus Woesearchaeota archaeon]|nr:hypothetical protein [Candidatus Woesearchaeota archaeon]